MELLYGMIWTSFFILCLPVGYLIKQNINIRRYIGLSRYDHERSRMNFLNNTFCGKFIKGNWEKTINVSEIVEHNRLLQLQMEHSDDEYEMLSCTKFITENDFYSKHITDLEYNNPMAFSILVYKNFHQFQVLMRTLYVRSNFHCIHVDRHASVQLFSYAVKLSECLDNVYVAHPRIKVQWGKMSILKAERLCQAHLLKQSPSWHYHMTIAGTELPIQTNLNRIQILQLVPDKSRNDVSSYPQLVNRQRSKKIPPPGNITIYKGEFHSILTRGFIQVVHTERLPLAFRSYLKRTIIPDEQFYSSLVRLPQLPGGRARVVPTYYHYDQLSHYKSWKMFSVDLCRSGQFDGNACQFNYKDLSRIEESGRLFVNKFNQEMDLVGIDCWEEWLKIKQNHHQDIDPRKYIDRYPMTRRNPHTNDTQTTTSKSKVITVS